MNITLSNTTEIIEALENYRSKEIDKLHRMKMQVHSNAKSFDLLNISCAFVTQIRILEQADYEQLAQMYLQKNLLADYEDFINDPQFILGTNVEVTLTIGEKAVIERPQPMYYTTVKSLHEDLIDTVDSHYSNFSENQWTLYEAALEGIELALQNIDTLPPEYNETFAFESNAHKYEVSFFKHF